MVPAGTVAGAHVDRPTILVSVISFPSCSAAAHAVAAGPARATRPVARTCGTRSTSTSSRAVAGTRKRVTLPDGTVLDLAVPEGVTQGQVLRLKGKGEAGTGGGPAGDALVEIKIRLHATFTRVGDDITSKLPISIDEAVLGAKVEVATVTGSVNLTIPKGTSTGRTFRLRGKGVKNAASGQTGDQLVTVEIVLPDEIDERLSYFMQEWRNSHGYNPRRKR